MRADPSRTGSQKMKKLFSLMNKKTTYLPSYVLVMLSADKPRLMSSPAM